VAKTKTAASKRSAPRPARLGPGLHAVTIELRTDEVYRVHSLDGARVAARLGDDVDAALAEECLRTGRPVIAADTERGATILGALQTRLPFERGEDGQLAVRAKDLRFVAERSLSIEAGGFALRVDKAGAARLEGDRLVIDMSEIVRVLAARVELP
jgi:hypothetical protein